ncbi:MAG: acyl-CoA dehydrogenase family protein [Myxococcota bacterium]
MDLDFSDEQLALRDLVRDVCANASPIDVVRAMEDDPRGYPDALWKQLAEVGVLGIRVPEAYGGAGQGLLETAIAYEELGRALAPTPHLPSCVWAAGVLARAGSEAQKRAWLPRIANGDAVLAPAWLEPDGGFGPRGIALRAEPDGDGARLSGVKRHVPFASAAERLVVLARSGAADEAIDLWLVEPGAKGVSLTQQHALASDTQYRVELDGVRVGAADRIGPPASGYATHHDAMLEVAVCAAAWAIGGAEQALAITTQYAKDRRQFGKPLGAFQAISHYLADAKTRIDGGRTLVHQAAWAADHGGDAARLAPMAKLFACQTYRDVTATCQQVWGGVGFTVEYDIQLYFRRAKQMQLSWWDARHLRELIARDELD